MKGYGISALNSSAILVKAIELEAAAEGFQVGWWEVWMIYKNPRIQVGPPPQKKTNTNIMTKSTMNEDVFPVEHEDFPMSCYFPGVYVLRQGFPLRS